LLMLLPPATTDTFTLSLHDVFRSTDASAQVARLQADLQAAQRDRDTLRATEQKLADAERANAEARREVAELKARLAASAGGAGADRKSTRLNSSYEWISYAVFCLK